MAYVGVDDRDEEGASEEQRVAQANVARAHHEQDALLLALDGCREEHRVVHVDAIGD
jgi:hypothetical protein